MSNSILVIDSDPIWRDRYRLALVPLAKVEIANSINSSQHLLANNQYAIIILDANLRNALPFLQQHRLERKEEVIIIGTNEKLDVAACFYHSGGTYFLSKNTDHIPSLLTLIEQIFYKKQLANIPQNEEQKPQQQYYFNLAESSSSKLRQIAQTIELLKNTDTHVLITGETGTGKTLLGRLIHRKSRRKNHAFMELNCPSFNSNLIESELFGYRKGAFTGAINDKKGKFEFVGRGTIFLDEIGELTADVQAKLLKVIDERTYYPIGSDKQVLVRARLIAATNINLEKALTSGQFRTDLYYRLNTFHFKMPPLREHIDDIPVLLNLFVKKYSLEYKIAEPEIDKNVYSFLMEYNWPGNIRELDNIVKNVMVFKPSRLSVALISENMPNLSEFYPNKREKDIISLRQTMARYARNCYCILNKNQSETARALKINRRTLARLLKDSGEI